MITSLNKTASKMLELFAGLNEKVVSWWDADWNALAGVARPNVKAWVAGTTMNGEEVEIGVEACENGVFLTVLDEV